MIASTPGVASFTSDSLLTATADDGAPRTQSAVDSSTLQLRASADGRYTRQDRPVVHEGRMIRDGREAFLDLEAARSLDAHVRDEIPVSFWVTSTTTDTSRGPSTLVQPIGHASLASLRAPDAGAARSSPGRRRRDRARRQHC